MRLIRYSPPFQFHKGTIKTALCGAAAEYKDSFNSIRVRLKPYVMCESDSAYMFQFHKGTIKTKFRLRADEITQ